MFQPFRRLRGAFASLCTITVLSAVLTGCGGSDGDAPETTTPPPVTATGSITGQVLSAADASPVAGARINAAGASTVTDAQGRFTLGALAPSSNVVLRIQADGHVDAVLPLPVTANEATTVTKRLVAAGNAQTFSAAAAATLRAANPLASVDLPANGLVVDGGSTAATGTVSARLSVVDPARDPAAMPGGYVTSTGGTMESFGAITVDLRDAGGNKLNLKQGATATVRIPLSTRSPNPPATVPLFHLDETTGRWVKEGEATLKTTAEGRYYEGSVSHFSTWNADIEMDTIFVNGCVNDSAGQPARWALVQSSGIDYSGMSLALTDTAGKFRIAIRKSSLAELWATQGDLSSPTVPVGPSDVDITLPNCLVLGAPAAPQLLGTLADRTVAAGEWVEFRARATGGALRYQWRRNGVDLPGETYDTLRFTARAADDGARYSCVVSNALGQVTTAAALLRVNAVAAPVIDAAPVNRSATVGGTATFSVSATGSAPLRYQWQRNGVDVAGATGPTLVTPALTLADHGARYRVVVSNAAGSVTSSEATLSVTALAAPAITTQPAAVTVAPGQTATFAVAATGSPAPTYQWLKNGSAIAGATSATYTTPVLALADSGAVYSVRLSNSQGEVLSDNAVLTVKADDRADLMRLLGTAGIWLQALGAPMEITDEDGRVLASGAVCEAGTVSATLNGATPTAGQMLPPTGTVATRFTSCMIQGTRYDGNAAATYEIGSLQPPVNGTFSSTIDNLRMAETGGQSDYTINGGGSVSLSGRLDNGAIVQDAVLSPTGGTTITNNLLGLRATLVSGSFTVGSTIRAADDRLLATSMGYNDFSLTVGGVPYLARGNLTVNFDGSNGLPAGGSGEITLSSNGTQVGRLYFANGSLQIEVNGSVQPFAAGRPGAAALSRGVAARASRSLGTPRTPTTAGR